MLSRMKRHCLAPVIFGLCLILFNIAIVGSDNLVNCSPVVASLFCGAALYRRNQWLLPTAAIAWLISITYTSSMHGDYSPWSLITLSTIAAFALVVGIGVLFQKSKKALHLLGGTLLAASMFYAVTNSFSFLTSPLYPKTIEGFTQAMWTGLAQFTHPTWVFFRNSLLSSAAFTTLFLSVMQVPAIRKASRFRLLEA